MIEIIDYMVKLVDYVMGLPMYLAIGVGTLTGSVVLLGVTWLVGKIPR